jgi:predicted lipoprotein with Yx(FWY)xxD motif
MKRLLTAVAAAVAVLALAACGGGGADSSSDSSAATTSSNDAATVSVEEIGDAGRVLVGPDGKALYTADQEADSNVLCNDACLSFWTPLTIDEGAPTASSVPGMLGVSERPDGIRQVTLDGKRLYSFAEDDPGEVTGDGFEDSFDGQQFTWHVARVAGSPDSDSGGSTTDGPFDY